jgi:hypothetical protein
VRFDDDDDDHGPTPESTSERRVRYAKNGTAAAR